MKNIWKGCYLRYDGQLVYVLDTMNDIDTGEQMVVCRFNAPKAQHYYVIGRESFLGTVETAGKKVPKYRRFSPSRALSEEDAERAYQCSGEYPPEQTVKRKKASYHSPGSTYLAYAKDICESYLYDVRKYNEGLPGEEYDRARKNVEFIESCMANELSKYAEYFRERFIEGKSIQKYAAEHGINRGSVDYIQKKLFNALAQKLKEAAKEKFEE